MKNILITGANGFVGQALCKRMVLDGWYVRGAVRSSENAAKLPAGIEAIEIKSLSADTNWSEALTEVDVVVHLAARVHVMNDNVSDPLSVFRQINVMGTEHLARMSAANSVKRFVFISSIKVNGEGAEKPYVENAAVFPQDPYGVSKWEAEQALYRVAGETGMEVVILRPPLVYGPGVKANFLTLIKLLYRDVPLPLSSINNLRSFIYVGNLVDAVVTGINNSNAAGQTYLVSDGEDISTPELIRKIAEALGRPAKLFPFPLFLMRFAGKLTGKTDTVERLVGSLTIDNSKICKELGWKPPYTMADGLKETAEWYKMEKP